MTFTFGTTFEKVWLTATHAIKLCAVVSYTFYNRKKMKKIIAVLSLGMLVVGSSFAQTVPQKNQQEKRARMEQRGDRSERTKKSPEEMAQLKTERMAQKLDLTAAQKNQLQALNLRQAEEMKAMRESMKGSEDRTKIREARKASHDKWQAELKSILTAEQYAKYEADHEQMQQKRAEGKKGLKSGEYKKSGEHKKRGEYRKQQG